MEHTEYYQLSLWEQDDHIQMEDFNADNQKIDTALAAAGNCKITIGSYVGNGQSGSAHPNTLTLPFEPKAIFVSKYDHHLCYRYLNLGVTRDQTNVYCYASNDVGGWLNITWEGNQVSWYTSSNNNAANCQLNGSGVQYVYLALG